MEDISQELTQAQGVEAEVDASYSLEPYNKERGEKAMRCEAGCDVRVRVHQSIDPGSEEQREARPKSMSFDTTAPWREDFTIRTTQIWLEDDNGAAYANRNKERLTKVNVWIVWYCSNWDTCSF